MPKTINMISEKKGFKDAIPIDLNMGTATCILLKVQVIYVRLSFHWDNTDTVYYLWG